VFDYQTEATLTSSGNYPRLAVMSVPDLEQPFQNWLERAEEAMLIIDAGARRFIGANQTALRLFKLDRAALLQIGPAEVSPLLQPDGQLSSAVIWQKIGQAMVGETPAFAWMYRNAAGENVPCTVQLERFPNDERQLVCCRILNLNREKQHEQAPPFQVQQPTSAVKAQQIEVILEHVCDAILLADEERRILYVNPAWEKMTGCSADEALGQTAFFLVDTERQQEILRTLCGRVLSGETWSGVLLCTRKDGSRYDAEVTVTPIKNELGEIHRFVGVQRDVTEARKLESLKMRFVADAAHDLGNPVANLKMRLYLLQKNPQRTAEHLAMMEKLIGRLDALVKDLLTLSRLDLGVLTTDLVHLDLNTVIARVVEVCEPMAENKGLLLSFQPSPDLPRILADEQQIERVVTNLISNAINYTLPSGTIHLSTQRAGERAVFTIRDTGIGINAQALPFIFERFYRSDEAKHTAEGTGLGLAIVKEIVVRHGGTIEVESIPEQGTLFTVSLPAAASAPLTGERVAMPDIGDR